MVKPAFLCLIYTYTTVKNRNTEHDSSEYDVPQSLGEQASLIYDDLKKYINVRYRYAKLDASEKLIRIIGGLAAGLIIFLLITGIIVFLSFSVAFYLGSLWDDFYLGFAVVTGFYVLMTFIVYSLRKVLIVQPIHRLMINVIFKSEKED